MIDQRIAPHLVIRDRDDLVVDLFERGAEGGDVGDLAIHAGQGHEVANAERPENGQHDTGCDRFQRILQGKADGQRSAAEQGGKRGGREAELGQRQDNGDGKDQILQERGREGKQRVIRAVTHMGLVPHLAHGARDPIGKQDRDDKDCDGRKRAGPAPVDDGFPVIAGQAEGKRRHEDQCEHACNRTGNIPAGAFEGFILGRHALSEGRDDPFHQA